MIKFISKNSISFGSKWTLLFTPYVLTYLLNSFSISFLTKTVKYFMDFGCFTHLTLRCPSLMHEVQNDLVYTVYS